MKIFIHTSSNRGGGPLKNDVITIGGFRNYEMKRERSWVYGYYFSYNVMSTTWLIMQSQIKIP